MTIVSVVGTITQTFEVHYKDGSVARPKPTCVRERLRLRASTELTTFERLCRVFKMKKVDHRASPSLTVPIHNPATCSVLPGPVDAIPGQDMQPLPDKLSFRPVSDCCAIHPDVDVPDPSPLVRLAAGQEFHHSRICRVPTDDYVRPSTLEGSPKTVIRVAHKLSVEVRYRKDGDTEDMILTMGKPVVITSWCAHLSLPFSAPLACCSQSLSLGAAAASSTRSPSRPTAPTSPARPSSSRSRRAAPATCRSRSASTATASYCRCVLLSLRALHIVLSLTMLLLRSAPAFSIRPLPKRASSASGGTTSHPPTRAKAPTTSPPYRSSAAGRPTAGSRMEGHSWVWLKASAGKGAKWSLW